MKLCSQKDYAVALNLKRNKSNTNTTTNNFSDKINHIYIFFRTNQPKLIDGKKSMSALVNQAI